MDLVLLTCTACGFECMYQNKEGIVQIYPCSKCSQDIILVTKEGKEAFELGLRMGRIQKLKTSVKRRKRHD